MELYIGPVIMLFIIFSLIVWYIIENKPSKHSLEKEFSKVIYADDFMGPFQPSKIVRVETGISYFYTLINHSGVEVKSFCPDWGKSMIKLFALRNGYSIEFVDY